MEIDAQKMEALRKASADMILNTAKEAAARIMVSERKAFLFQKDLSSTKDDALVLIVRLKQIMDAKITEAEIRACNQRKKIEELEAQLNEAEEIILDLRFKLKKVQPLNEQKNDSDPRPTIATDDTKIAPLLQQMAIKCDTKHLVPSNDSQIKNNSPDKSELSSIIMGSKMPELVTRDSEKDEENLTLPCESHSEPDKLMEPNSRILENPLGKVIQGRKRNIRFGKAQKIPRKSRLDNNHKPTGSSCVTAFLSENLTKSNGLEEILKRDNKGHQDQSSNLIPRGGYKKRKVKYRSTLATSYRSPPCKLDENDPPVPGCKTISQSLNGDVKFGGATISMTENREKTISDMVVSNSGNDQNTLKGSEVNNEISSQADNENPIKYTFLRKRKKVSLNIPDETTSLEKTSKRKTVEKHTGVLEPLKSSLIDEPTRDSRRLVQVARQLISLSGKKWR